MISEIQNREIKSKYILYGLPMLVVALNNCRKYPVFTSPRAGERNYGGFSRKYPALGAEHLILLPQIPFFPQNAATFGQKTAAVESTTLLPSIETALFAEITDEKVQRTHSNRKETRENDKRARENLIRTRDNREGARENRKGARENLIRTRDNREGARENRKGARENLIRTRDNREGARENRKRARENLIRTRDNRKIARENGKRTRDNRKGARENLIRTRDNRKRARINVQLAILNIKWTLEKVNRAIFNMKSARIDIKPARREGKPALLRFIMTHYFCNPGRSDYDSRFLSNIRPVFFINSINNEK